MESPHPRCCPWKHHRGPSPRLGFTTCQNSSSRLHWGDWEEAVNMFQYVARRFKMSQDSHSALELSTVSCPRRIPTQFVYYTLLVMQLQSQPHKRPGIFIRWCSSQFNGTWAQNVAEAVQAVQPLRGYHPWEHGWLVGWVFGKVSTPISKMGVLALLWRGANQRARMFHVGQFLLRPPFSLWKWDPSWAYCDWVWEQLVDMNDARNGSGMKRPIQSF